MNETCPFCGAAPKQVWRGEVHFFACGTRPYHLQPFTMACWQGLVWKLKERVEVLEGKVMVQPEDLLKAVTYTGTYARAGWWQRLRGALPEEIFWHPEIKQEKG